MQILTISSLFPNKNDPKHGIFVKTRLLHFLQEYPEVTATVIAPVPWFPFKSKRFGEYSKYAGVPAVEVIDGLTVYHPRYLVLPKIGMYLTPSTMYFAIKSCVKKLFRQQAFDVIDGHYFYPDGVAIERVAREVNIPFTCTARGTDINLVPQYPKALAMMQNVFTNAAQMITVCQALKDEMLNLGVDDSRITVLRNGVDLELFRPSNNEQQLQLKAKMQIIGPLVVSVGWLIERKGHYLIIEALKDLPAVNLLIIGDGPDRNALEQQAHQYGVSQRVTFLGAVDQPTLNNWLKAADALVLASSREGWANVLLESMASGAPVVASRVWGTPEVVQNEEVGVLVERNVNGIANGIKTLLAKTVNRQVVREYAEQFDWQSTSQGLFNIFKAITQKQ